MPGNVARLASGRAWWVSFAATVVLLLVANLPVLPVSAPVIAERSGGTRILDIDARPDPDAVYAAVARYDRGRYLWEIATVDLLLPLAYGSAFALALVLLARRVAPTRRRLRWVAAVAGLAVLADYAENASIAALLIAYPRRLDGLARAEIALTAVKNAAVGAALVLVVALASVWAWQALRRQPAPS